MLPRWFDELQEEFRAEEWQRFFVRYGIFFVAAIVLFFGFLGVYLWWQHAQVKEAERVSHLYNQGLTYVEAKDEQKAEEVMQLVVNSGHKGYACLARLTLLAMARDYARRTYDRDAIQTWQTSINSTLKEIYHQRDQALHAFLSIAYAFDLVAFLKVDFPALALYQTPQNPWRSLALEAKSLRELAFDRPHAAVSSFRTLFESDWTIPDVRLRSEMMMIFLGERFS